MTNKNDKLYAQRQAPVADFKFDDRVANVFSDMISRSVPGYAQILKLLPTLTRRFQMPERHYYDLGCSLGAGMLAMAEALQDINCKIIGVDNSGPMLANAKQQLDNYRAERSSSDAKSNFQLERADITGFALRPAAMVLMNFTLQFVPIDSRDALIKKIHAALVSGGVLVLSEKIKFNDQAAQQILAEVHHQYKADQGYSQMEISQKRDAIENVLIPESLNCHIKRLHQAGFSIVTPWLQNLQFVSILAIKQ